MMSLNTINLKTYNLQLLPQIWKILCESAHNASEMEGYMMHWHLDYPLKLSEAFCGGFDYKITCQGSL